MKGRPLPPEIKTMLNLIYLTYGAAFDLDSTHQEALKLKFKLAQIRQNDETGYYGISFQHIETGAITLVHRGTDSIDVFKPFATIRDVVKNLDIRTVKNIILSLRTDVRDDALIASDGNPKQADDAFTFLNEVVQNNKEANIIQIGHSLGGCLAEICYQRLDEEIETYAFDSPGYAVTDTGPIGPKAIHYFMSSPHAINTCLPHLDSSRPNIMLH